MVAQTDWQPHICEGRVLRCPCGERLYALDSGGGETTWTDYGCPEGHLWTRAYASDVRQGQMFGWRKVWRDVTHVRAYKATYLGMERNPALIEAWNWALLPLGWERGR